MAEKNRWFAANSGATGPGYEVVLHGDKCVITGGFDVFRGGEAGGVDEVALRLRCLRSRHFGAWLRPRAGEWVHAVSKRKKCYFKGFTGFQISDSARQCWVPVAGGRGGCFMV